MGLGQSVWYQHAYVVLHHRWHGLLAAYDFLVLSWLLIWFLYCYIATYSYRISILPKCSLQCIVFAFALPLSWVCQSAPCTVLYLYFCTAFAFKKNAFDSCLIANVCPSWGSFGGSFRFAGDVRWRALGFALRSSGFVLGSHLQQRKAATRSQEFERGKNCHPNFGAKGPTSSTLGVKFGITWSKPTARKYKFDLQISELNSSRSIL